ncbi:lambda-exonuclease family protein [Microbispora rosea]|uniref:YqaJ viral recombinase family nuclease n=1 Tax=Microbispora rosea TaxID=58117 RepID=UPI00343A0764
MSTTYRRIAPTAVQIAPVGLPRPDWLTLRRLGICGSDVPAMVGLDRYTSERELYHDKRGELPDLPRSPELEEAAEFGNEFEAVVARRFAAATGTRVRRIGMLRHVHDEWRMVNLDRRVLGCPDGPCFVEIKTRSAYQADQWEDGVPDGPALQTHWGIGVTGYGHAHVAALIGGNRFKHFRIDRDEELLDDLVGIAGDFMEAVREGNPPPVDGSPANTDLMARLWETAADSITAVDAATTTALIAEREKIRTQIKASEEDLAAVENQLKDLLGPAEVGVIGGDPAVTWKRNGTFSTKQFEQRFPELAARCRKTVEVLDLDAIKTNHPDEYRACRARVLRIPGGKA